MSQLVYKCIPDQVKFQLNMCACIARVAKLSYVFQSKKKNEES